MPAREFRPLAAPRITADERIIKGLHMNDEGFNYPTYPVEILELRCRRWARVSGLNGTAGHTAANFCKRARKKVMKHVADGGIATEGLPTNTTSRERNLFSINPAFHNELCEIVLNHIEHSKRIEDLNQEFIFEDAPLNETR